MNIYNLVYVVALALSIILLLVHTLDKFDEMKRLNEDLQAGDYKDVEEKKNLESWRMENFIKVFFGLAVSVFDLILVIFLI